VESSVAPDLVRFLSGTDGTPGINRSGIFNSINFSRKSVSLDLTNPKAREIAQRLVKVSDIATENYTVGNMKKFGLDYETLRAIKPDLIMLSGTPLGQTGPYANTVGFGPTTQAFAGMCHLTGYPGDFPCGIGGTWPDFAVGTAMVFFILAALHHRDQTGEGQYLDLSMAETVTTMLPEAMMDYFLNWRDNGPIGNRDTGMAPHGVFPVKGDDQWIAIAIASDQEFESLCEVLGVPALAKESRFARLASRLANVDDLEREVASRMREFERDALLAKLRERNLAVGPVYGPLDLMEDPALRESGMLIELDHPESGIRVVPGLPVTFSAMEPDYRPAPAIGADSEAVLGELLGYSRDEIARFRHEKVII
jgi:benzylsuccinate CoA-transferase BbsF subunit